MNKLFLLAAAFSLSACMIPQPYISDEYQKYRPSDLKVPERPYVLKLETEFSRNGTPLPAVVPTFTNAVNQALNETRVAVSAPQAENSLKISADNIADLGQAARSGVKTGLTLGISGSTVQDDYRFICSYSDGKQELSHAEFKHAIVSTIGASNAPIGMTRQLNVQQAFNSITRDIVVNCLGDLQKKGYLLP